VPVDADSDAPEAAPYVAAQPEASEAPTAESKPSAAAISPENGGALATSGGTPEYAIAAPAAESAPVPSPVVPAPAPAKPANRGLFGFFSSSAPAPAVDWGTRFRQAAEELGDRGLEYNDEWRPPGESRAWAMDCSNTTRYLYKATTGIELPRTASDQYYYLHLQDKAWDVPQAANGFADCNYLRRNLKPGDLLFWENTYRPERQPPITHVMVFLGTNERGDWLMAGSQSGRGGAHNRRHGGPDIYVFDPTRPCGGYTTWMGLVHHQGRFCAYGRPLEADKSKLSVAAND
jgi:cell wall-associated NlpC family hydrolase